MSKTLKNYEVSEHIWVNANTIFVKDNENVENEKIRIERWMKEEYKLYDWIYDDNYKIHRVGYRHNGIINEPEKVQDLLMRMVYPYDEYIKIKNERN